MAIEFPSSPALNQEFTIEATGQIYYWDGSTWSAKPPIATYANNVTTASYALSALSASTSVTVGSKSPQYQVFAYLNSVGTVASNTNLKINFYNTVLNKVGSSWNTSSGDFTCPAGGLYRVDSSITYNSHNSVSSSRYSTYVTKNGVNMGETRFYPMMSLPNIVCTGNNQALIDCNTGDILSFWIFQNSGTFLYVTPWSGSGYVSIERLITY